MNEGNIIIYRDESLETDTVMQLRLTYRGPLRSNRCALDKDRNSPQYVKLAEHKHQIRQEFHRQLVEFWKIDPRLRDCKMYKDHFDDGFPQPTAPTETRWANFNGEVSEQLPVLDLVRGEFPSLGYEWVPLILEKFSLVCELDILLLKRDGRHSPLENGDIDNRVKTLIDCLKTPRGKSELGDKDSGPLDGENPFFVLLQDDALVTKLSVETDILYDPRSPIPKSENRVQERQDDDQLVHAVITVNIKPYNVNMFNLMFA